MKQNGNAKVDAPLEVRRTSLENAQGARTEIPWTPMHGHAWSTHGPSMGKVWIQKSFPMDGPSKGLFFLLQIFKLGFRDATVCYGLYLGIRQSIPDTFLTF